MNPESLTYFVLHHGYHSYYDYTHESQEANTILRPMHYLE